jgi:hypothetical protein
MRWLAAFLIGLCLMAPRTAAAQGAPSIAELYDGDCAITVGNVPSGIDIHHIAVTVTTQTLTVRPAVRSGTTVTLKLFNPVHEGDVVGARLPEPADIAIPAVTVRQALQREDPPPDRCVDKRLPDDREVFEASAYLGRSFDNFAPAERGQYFNLPDKLEVDSRWLAGTEAQYRLIGDKGDNFQIWLSEFTLHGVRTSDVNCNETPNVPVCGNKPQDKFLAILEHASSLEAHFDTRVEFLTLQPTTATSAKVFGFARFGFASLSGAPKVYNADALGLGLIAPAGIFKNSSATVAWGRSEQFQSAERAENPRKWQRLKISGTLVFDVVPGFKDRVEFWKRLAGSPRVFVSIYVDRNPGGPGPDSVTTYVGVDLDLRRMFFGFGG